MLLSTPKNHRTASSLWLVIHCYIICLAPQIFFFTTTATTTSAFVVAATASRTCNSPTATSHHYLNPRTRARTNALLHDDASWSTLLSRKTPFGRHSYPRQHEQQQQQGEKRLFLNRRCLSRCRGGASRVGSIRDDNSEGQKSKRGTDAVAPSGQNKSVPDHNNAEEGTSRTFRITASVLALALLAVAIHYQQHWVPLLMDKQKLQAAAVQALEGLRPPEYTASTFWTDALPSYAVYTLGMTAWEFLGLSTIPVETAAGMVFGWPWAAICSGGGKLLGASLAYGLSKWRLQSYVQNHKMVKQSRLCQLLAATSSDTTSNLPKQEQKQLAKSNNKARRRLGHPPLVSALLMKFSCFPETIKNFGTAALLPSVTYGCFLMATCMHGIMFTLLWTWFGVETSQQLQSTASATAATVAKTSSSMGLQIALTLTLVLGFLISPLSMAWWYRDLQRQADLLAQQGQTQNGSHHVHVNATSSPTPAWRNSKLAKIIFGRSRFQPKHHQQR